MKKNSEFAGGQWNSCSLEKRFLFASSLLRDALISPLSARRGYGGFTLLSNLVS